MTTTATVRVRLCRAIHELEVDLEAAAERGLDAEAANMRLRRAGMVEALRIVLEAEHEQGPVSLAEAEAAVLANGHA